MNGTYGKFSVEAEGRLAGTVLEVPYRVYPRKDGRVEVLYCFGSGKRLRKLLKPEVLKAEIAKIEGAKNG